MTTELYDRIIERGASTVWRQLHDEIEQILADPFGETSIDSLKDRAAGRWVRLVHQVTGPLADLVPGAQLALKGTGLQMENAGRLDGAQRTTLSEQFGPSLDAWRRQVTLAPDGIGDCLFVNKPYGVFRYTDRTGATAEWLLMEYVNDAQTMEEQQAWGGGGPLFEDAQYPEMAALAAAVSPNPYDRGGVMGMTTFGSLGAAIAQELGYDPNNNLFLDIDGPNVLVQETDRGRRYTTIDILSHTQTH